MKQLLAILALSILVPVVPAADPTYWEDIRPILRRNCTVCHNERKLDDVEVSGGLALNTFELLKKKRKSNVLTEKAESSLLYTLLVTKNVKRRMPLDAEPMTAEDIATIKKWIDTGAAEGTKPKDVSPVATTTARARRKLDVSFGTKLLMNKKPVEMVLPIGPLPPVAATTFSPDGKYLAVGTYGRVTVWDLATAKVSHTLTNVLAAVNDIKFSPDGSLLAVSGGQPSVRGDLRLFSTKDWKLVHNLGGHLDVVSGMSFSPDGKQLASASFDKTVRLWTVADGKLVHSFTGHSDFVYAVAFSPKGSWYATASKDRTGRVVDALTGKSKLTFSGMEQEVLSVAVRNDGLQVMTSGYEPQLFWWDAATGERLKRQGGHDKGVAEIATDRAGKIVVSAGLDQTVRLWNPQTAAVIRSIPVGSIVYATAIDPAGKRVVAGSTDGRVRVFDVDTARLLATLWAGDTGWLANTQEGYVSTSTDLAVTWKLGPDVATDVKPFAVLNSSANVAKSLAGQKLDEPKLP